MVRLNSCFPILARITSIAMVTLAAVGTCAAGDWPMWRGNGQRTGSVEDSIELNLHLQWERELAPATPAWPAEQPKLRFDDAANPVSMGERIFVNSSTHDSVTAYSTRTGEQIWQFLADGPVRFAPVATSERIYFVSDDGFLYCVATKSGKLLWKKRGGPSGRLLLGNQRMISSWPARGGPVIHDGVVYFGASIWPFMGVFFHAVDAVTGETIWTNSGSGMKFTVQPHGASSFASVVPQGHMVINKDQLIVPGGRSVPAVFDRRTGDMLHFDYIKKRGGHNVMAANGQYVVSGDVYRASDGGQLDSVHVDLFDGKHFLSCEKDTIVGYSQKYKKIEETTRDRIGRKKTKVSYEREKQWSRKVAGGVKRLIAKTGSIVWAADGNRLAAYDLNSEDEDPGWTHQFESGVWDAIFADDRMFVITKENRVYCFGAEAVAAAPRHSLIQSMRSAFNGYDAAQIAAIANGVDTTGGYALVLGMKSGRLAYGLAEETDMDVIVLPAPGDDVQAARSELMANRLYGDRITILSKSVTPRSLPKYFASLICSEYRNVKAEQALRLYDCLRPYGGRLVLSGDDRHYQHMQAACEAFEDPQATLRRDGRLSVVERTGALPDSSDWTHQYATASQSGISAEARVKAPFGVLWFGGPSHAGVLPRHGHGPSPQVAGGRLVIEGPDMLRAVDIYTGRLLWQKRLPELGKFYDNLKHMPGAGEIGSNYVTLVDRVYVVYGERLLELDAVTGETIREYSKPEDASDDGAVNWGYVAVDGDYLIATSSPVKVVKADDKETVEQEEREVIAKGASWKYLAGKDPSRNWTGPNFDDNDWLEGPAGFGYGDDDDATTLSDMKDNYSRVYLRKKIDGEQLAGALKTVLYCKYDDGFIAYLNGTEICRKHVKRAGRKAKVDGHEAEKFEEFEIEDWQKLTVSGANVLAIEAHNIDKGSSDFSIDPYLAIEPGTSHPTMNVSTGELRALLEPVRYSSGSLRINVFDRRTGDQLWYRDAEYNFRHNSICAANGRLFCIDMLSLEKRRALDRRGLSIKSDAKLYSLDLDSGEVVWSTNEKVFGTFLNYSAEHDVLVQGGSLSRDRAYDEIGKGMSAYRGTTGERLWSDMKLTYNGPVMLWRDKIVTNGNGGFSVAMETGKRTGWKYKREYGCNTAIGCQNFLTFRSGAAGYYDMLNDSGTANLGGFRSSCTNNLIPGGGLLNAPDYTRTCTCSYQNQTSLALVHMPEAETWSFGGNAKSSDIAINFGAPGDRRSADGTMWVDYPSVGGKSPKRKIKTKPAEDKLKTFRVHSSLVANEHDWISGSGVLGIKEIELSVDSKKPLKIVLYFCEPSEAKSRSFRIDVNGKTVAPEFNVALAAGGSHRGVARTFVVTPDSKKIRINFRGDREAIVSGLKVLGE